VRMGTCWGVIALRDGRAAETLCCLSACLPDSRLPACLQNQTLCSVNANHGLLRLTSFSHFSSFKHTPGQSNSKWSTSSQHTHTTFFLIDQLGFLIIFSLLICLHLFNQNHNVFRPFNNLLL